MGYLYLDFTPWVWLRDQEFFTFGIVCALCSKMMNFLSFPVLCFTMD